MNRKKALFLIITAIVLIGAIVPIALILHTKSYTVTFQDYDGTVLKEEIVQSGKSATAPETPTREGYTFVGWDKSFEIITEDIVVTAQYISNAESSFVVDTVTIAPGTKKVEVKVSVANNPGILGMVLSVSFDEETFDLVDCKNGVALSALAFQEPSRLISDCNFVWYGSKIGEIVDGEMLVLTFEIANDAKPGTYPITISWKENAIFDHNSNSLNPAIVQGSIIIPE